MSLKKSIIPEFMANNPRDTFQFLMPLKLKLDEEQFGNSHYEVVVKNMNTQEIFTYLMSPELLFTNFSLGKPYQNGNETYYYSNKYIYEQDFVIDTRLIDVTQKYKLKDFLDDKTIRMLLAWDGTHTNVAKNINCHIVEQDNIKIIFPSYAIGIYYYFRFTDLREAILDMSLESFYVMCENNPLNAQIVLPKKRSDQDAAFIYRYACQDSAKNEFDNVGQYIHRYIDYMRRNNIDQDVEDIHLIINFPIKEEFEINTRISKLTNQNTDEQYYYVHEILNDYSSIGFDKLTKIIEEKKILTDIDDIGNLPKVDKEIPNDPTDILKIIDANKKYTGKHTSKAKKDICGSLENIQIDQSSIQKDIITDLLKIYQEQLSDELVDQSLTESSSKGDKKTRKISVSSEFLEERVSKPLAEIDNFVVFKQYTNFLQQSSEVKNFYLSEVKKLPEYKVDKNGEKVINPKCKIKKRIKEYLTATFEYNNYYVGLLELENNPSSSNSTWVIISDCPITCNIFEYFMHQYFQDNIEMNKIVDQHKNTNPKFIKKNHERDENLDIKQLANWYAGLIGKIILY